MRVGDFYIVPESKEEDDFIDSELNFLLDLSLRGKETIKTKDEYGKIVLDRFNAWNKGKTHDSKNSKASNIDS